MSLIFGGLQRLHFDLNEDAWSEINLKDTSTCKGETNVTQLGYEEQNGSKIYIQIHPIRQDWENETKNVIAISTQSERYLINRYKENLLENACFYIPRIFYTFRPAYCVQLSMRFLIKQLTGTENEQEISHYISNNNRFVRYFGDIFEIAKHVFNGNFMIYPDQFSKELNSQIFMSLVELINIQSGNKCTQIHVSSEQLVNWGDCSSFFNKNNNTAYLAKQVERPNKLDLCMYTGEFVCIQCTQHYDTHGALLEHIQELHKGKLFCKICNVEFKSYSAKLNHCVTFCRAPILTKLCMECKFDEGNCTCVKNFKALIGLIEKKIIKEKNNVAFQIDVLSVMLNFYYENCQDMTISYKEDEYASAPSLTIENRSEAMFPVFDIVGEYIKCEQMDLNVNYAILKNALADYFINGCKIENHLLACVELLRDCCVFKECSENFDINHIKENHPLCTFGKIGLSQEVLYRFETADKMLLHTANHQVKCSNDIFCKFCEKQLNDGGHTIQFGMLLKHIESHSKDSLPRDNPCKIKVHRSCGELFMKASLTEIAHLLQFHVMEQNQILNVFYNCLDMEERSLFQTPKMTKKSLSFKDEFSEDDEDFSTGNLFKTTKLFAKQSNNGIAMTAFPVEKSNRLKMGDNGNPRTELIGQKHFCLNEGHEKKIPFDTFLQLRRHIAAEHKCPNCSFSCMFTSELELHFQIHEQNMKQLCHICMKNVIKINEHIVNTHPICVSCKVHFIDLQSLKIHEPICGKLVHVSTDQMQPESQKLQNQLSLQIDDSELECSFTKTLIKLLERSGLSNEDIKMGTGAIQKFASENTISKNRSRLENISVRKNDSLFFDLPSFHFTEKSNLAKVLQSMGTVPDEQKFNGRHSTAKQQAVANFELLDIILKKMEKFILIGCLTEKLAVNVLSNYFTQRLIDEISSYMGSDWKSLSYLQILSAVQFLMIPLDLLIFQNIVLAYRQIQGESFLEFSSRVFRHLKLCSRLLPLKAREQYIENKRCAILKQNLPNEVLEQITRKELMYKSFSSKEIIDHVVSFFHRKSSNKKYELEQYQVFNLRRVDTSNQRSSLRTEQETVNKQRQEKINSSQKKFLEPRNKKLPFIKAQSFNNENGIKNQFKFNIDIIRRELQKWNLPIACCYACLQTSHFRNNCPHYGKSVAITNTMCLGKSNNKTIPLGFHSKIHCNHPRVQRIETNNKNIYFTEKLNQIQRNKQYKENEFKVQNNQGFPKKFDGEKVFRPYKLPGKFRE